MPAEAGIQSVDFKTCLDARLRGHDGHLSMKFPNA